jgi:hypothetical protein
MQNLFVFSNMENDFNAAVVYFEAHFPPKLLSCGGQAIL